MTCNKKKEDGSTCYGDMKYLGKVKKGGDTWKAYECLRCGNTVESKVIGGKN